MKNPIRFRSLILVTFALAMVLFSACSAPAPSQVAMESMVSSDMAVSVADKAMAEEAMFEAAEAAGETFPDATAQRKIIGTANIDLVVSDTDAAVMAITRLATEGGGYVADSSFYRTAFGDETALQGNMTLRVPALLLDDMLAQLAALAVDVTSQSLTRDDVTDQYTDLSARLRNLEATEGELRQLLSEVRAKPEANAEDILVVHRNLMDIRGQIEQVQGRITMLDNLAALSTIHLSLRPDVSALPIVEAKWQPGATVANALRSLVASMQALGDAAIWLTIYVLPIFLLLLLPVVIFLWLAWVAVRRMRGKRNVIRNA